MSKQLALTLTGCCPSLTWPGGKRNRLRKIFTQRQVKRPRQVRRKLIVWSVGEDIRVQPLADPLGNDGRPFVDPGLREFDTVAADEPQQRMLAGDGLPHGGLWLATLSLRFRHVLRL